MKIRKLLLTDAPYMLEWMHDDFVVHDLATSFATKTIADCENFIRSAANETNEVKKGYNGDLHLAIASCQGEYMGTVSLKHINRDTNTAEFAITIRRSAMGKGYSQYAMNEIINLAFNELNIQKIYWCVNKKNIRARKFYDKQGYQITEASEEMMKYYKDYEKNGGGVLN